MNLEKTVDWLGLLPKPKAHARPWRSVQLDELMSMLHLILHHLHTGQPYSKRAITALGYDQRYWNLANAILVGVGLRDPSGYRRWQSFGSLRQDLRFVTERLELSDGVCVSVLQPNGAWTEINLYQCHFWG